MSEELSAEERAAVDKAREERAYGVFAGFMKRFLEESKAEKKDPEEPPEPPKKTTPPRSGFLDGLFGG